MHRAEEKRAIQENIENAASKHSANLNSIPITLNLEYQPIEIIGKYSPDNEIFIDNIIVGGKAGYYVMTQFIYNNNQVIYINRGWIQQGRTRQDLPTTTIPNGRVSLTGTLNLPRSKPPMLGNMQNNLDDSKVYLYADLEDLQKKIGKPIAPLIIRLSPNAEFGFVRKWPEFNAKVAMHIGYFFHWLLFALFTLVIYIYTGFKGAKE